MGGILAAALITTSQPVHADNSDYLDSIANEIGARIAVSDIYDSGFDIEQDENGNIRKFSLNGQTLVAATYSDGCRTHKEGEASCEFHYNGQMLVSEKRDGTEIYYNYVYDEDTYSYRYVGFVLNTAEYLYTYDDLQRIAGISDASGIPVAKYIYDESNHVSVLSEDAGEWIENSDPGFVGNYNCLRWYGSYFDQETGLYYANGMYDNICEGKVVGLEENNYILTEENPFADSSLLQPYSLNGYEEQDLQAELWSQELLANSSFNASRKPEYIASSATPTVEILARLIYGENTAYTTEQNAIAWVILNRYHSPRFPSTLRDVATARGQFTGAVHDNALQAQNPNETGWRNAVYLACLLVTDSSEACWNAISPKPYGFSNQLFFRAARYLGDTSAVFESNGVLYIRYTSNNTIRDVAISNACIAGKGTATTVDGLKALCTNGTKKYNVYFYHD